MKQPEGFESSHPDGRQWVCKLKKGLYGLRQSGRLWYEKLAKELERIGFTQLKSDPSIYTWAKDDVRVTLPVFVDDITITSKSKSKIDEVKVSLAKVFKLKDLGPTKYLLGIKVEYDRDNRVLCLSQTQYILDMLDRFRLSDCKPVMMPMDPVAILDKSQSPTTEEDKEEMRNIPYMNVVGALMYLAIGT